MSEKSLTAINDLINTFQHDINAGNEILSQTFGLNDVLNILMEYLTVYTAIKRVKNKLLAL